MINLVEEKRLEISGKVAARMMERGFNAEGTIETLRKWACENLSVVDNTNCLVEKDTSYTTPVYEEAVNTYKDAISNIDILLEIYPYIDIRTSGIPRKYNIAPTFSNLYGYLLIGYDINKSVPEALKSIKEHYENQLRTAEHHIEFLATPVIIKEDRYTQE